MSDQWRYNNNNNNNINNNNNNNKPQYSSLATNKMRKMQNKMLKKTQFIKIIIV